jgi:hypothetical protein
MKKKYRDIVVDGEKYAWSVEPNCDDGGCIIKIWKNKKILHRLWYQKNDSITPKTIETLIKSSESEREKLLSFDWS